MMFDCLARNAPPPLKNVMLMPKLRAYWTKNCNNLGRNTPRCWLFIVSIPLIPFRSDTQVLNFPAWTITDLEKLEIVSEKTKISLAGYARFAQKDSISFDTSEARHYNNCLLKEIGNSKQFAIGKSKEIGISETCCY